MVVTFLVLCLGVDLQQQRKEPRRPVGRFLSRGFREPVTTQRLKALGEIVRCASCPSHRP